MLATFQHMHARLLGSSQWSVRGRRSRLPYGSSERASGPSFTFICDLCLGKKYLTDFRNIMYELSTRIQQSAVSLSTDSHGCETYWNARPRLCAWIRLSGRLRIRRGVIRRSSGGHVGAQFVVMVQSVAARGSVIWCIETH